MRLMCFYQIIVFKRNLVVLKLNTTIFLGLKLTNITNNNINKNKGKRKSIKQKGGLSSLGSISLTPTPLYRLSPLKPHTLNPKTLNQTHATERER